MEEVVSAIPKFSRASLLAIIHCRGHSIASGLHNTQQSIADPGGLKLFEEFSA
jgi:hypothetical protein